MLKIHSQSLSRAPPTKAPCTPKGCMHPRLGTTGIVHFILITCQIKETVLRKCCCYCKSRYCRKTLPQLAHSIHLNVVRRNPRTKQETNETVIQEPVPTNDDVIQEPVPLMMSLLHTPMKVLDQQTN